MLVKAVVANGPSVDASSRRRRQMVVGVASQRSKAEQAQDLQGEDPPSLRDTVEVVDEKELSQKGRDSCQMLVRSWLLTLHRN